MGNLRFSIKEVQDEPEFRALVTMDISKPAQEPSMMILHLEDLEELYEVLSTRKAIHNSREGKIVERKFLAKPKEHRPTDQST